MENFIHTNNKAMKALAASTVIPNLIGNYSNYLKSTQVNSKITPETPASVIGVIANQLDFNIRLKEMNNMCYIFLNKQLFVDTMVTFLSLISNAEKLDFTFSTFANKGVIRLTGISGMLQLREEFICLSSMMKLFEGYALSDESSLTLVFKMRSMFN